jgi:hypothetical protein
MDILRATARVADSRLVQYHGAGFFVAVPFTSIDLKTATGADIHIEQRPGEELTCINGQRIAAEGINVWNPCFDVTVCLRSPQSPYCPLAADPFGCGLLVAARGAYRRADHRARHHHQAPGCIRF